MGGNDGEQKDFCGGGAGAQGGGLVRAILNDPAGGFAVRALTRDVNSHHAQDLAKL